MLLTGNSPLPFSSFQLSACEVGSWPSVTHTLTQVNTCPRVLAVLAGPGVLKDQVAGKGPAKGQWHQVSSIIHGLCIVVRD